MAIDTVCPKCGRPLAPDSPMGLCSKCLLLRGLEAGAGETPADTPFKDFVPPSPAEFAPHFPKLDIQALIGRGGMGAVYRARQKDLDRLVALKILPPEATEDPTFAERFAREARSLARLNHPGIVSVYDAGQAGGYCYLLMEWVDGTNLRQKLLSGQLQPQDALAFTLQICDALQSAHDQGLVHRDIKPENILIDTQGRVKVADFGIAKLLHRSPAHVSLTSSEHRVGTPWYMAPEQLQRPDAVDHRADIYSLGVLLYEMITGEVPMGHFDPPSQAAQVDPRLDPIVLRALARKPERRYQNVRELKADLETITHAAVEQNPSRATDDEMEKPTMSTTAPPLVLPATAIGLSDVPARRRWRHIGLAAVAAALVSLTALFLWPPRTEEGRRATKRQAPPPGTPPNPKSVLAGLAPQPAPQKDTELVVHSPTTNVSLTTSHRSDPSTTTGVVRPTISNAPAIAVNTNQFGPMPEPPSIKSPLDPPLDEAGGPVIRDYIAGRGSEAELSAHFNSGFIACLRAIRLIRPYLPPRPPPSNEALQQWTRGDITWAQVDGQEREALYQFAERAYTEFKSGDLAKATVWWEGLSCYNPYDAYFHQALAVCYQKQMRFDQAFAQHDLSLKYRSEDPLTLINRGECYLFLRRYDEAERDVQAALALAKKYKEEQEVQSAQRLLAEISKRRNADPIVPLHLTPEPRTHSIQQSARAATSDAEPPLQLRAVKSFNLTPERDTNSIQQSATPALRNLTTDFGAITNSHGVVAAQESAAARVTTSWTGSVSLKVIQHVNNTQIPEPGMRRSRNLPFGLRDGVFTFKHLDKEYEISRDMTTFVMDLYDKVPVTCQIKEFQVSRDKMRISFEYSGMAQYDTIYTKLRFSGAFLVRGYIRNDQLTISVTDQHGYGTDESMLPRLSQIAADGGAAAAALAGSIAGMNVFSVWEGTQTVRMQ